MSPTMGSKTRDPKRGPQRGMWGQETLYVYNVQDVKVTKPYSLSTVSDCRCNNYDLEAEVLLHTEDGDTLPQRYQLCN